MNILYHSLTTEVRLMTYGDIPSICKTDNDESEGNMTYLKNQLVNQDKQECSALIALYEGEIAGYVFLYYRCKWGGMANCNLPGVVDLIVFEKYRNKGIATVLMDVAMPLVKMMMN